jgi:transcriptional regulator with PAS, ATPase and Fis domain
MQSTQKHWNYSRENTESHLLPLKALVSERKGACDNGIRILDNNVISESQDIFADQKSKPARTMRAEIERVARRPYNILITGETGTGKTHAAREIHRRSARAGFPFMELNCANLPEHLVEAELFGYRKGAFTGADRDHMGLFEEANGGILFLDEIGDIPLTVQTRLLKAIEEKQIKRLGTNHYTFCDVQIIAATSRNLPTMIHNGEFREDLYCRLAVLTMETPPLRDRRKDIPAMVALFLREAADVVIRSANQRDVYRIEEDALALLCEFDYPGNIRALRNLVYELTSYLEQQEPISLPLVEFVLDKLRSRGCNHVAAVTDNEASFQHSDNNVPISHTERPASHDLPSFVRPIAHDGDIILPLELCVLRSGESFRQWTARAKRCSIEAARQATGGMQSAAERLGLTCHSLRAHLKRAKRNQNDSLFDWQNESD